MPSRLQIKRALFEWGAIASASLFVALLTIWACSLGGIGWDFWPVWSRYDLSISNGHVWIGNDLSAWDGIEMWERGASDGKVSGLLSEHSFRLPGLAYRYINLRWHTPMRRIRLSILIPTLATAIATTALVLAYRRTIRRLSVATVRNPPNGPVDFSGLD
jgi:hypothetical protein